MNNVTNFKHVIRFIVYVPYLCILPIVNFIIGQTTKGLEVNCNSNVEMETD
jgi:hypothetical protein